jgi:cold shock CspA family protein
VLAVNSGRVAEFEQQSGLGVITTAHGAEFPFHCVEIADGSRTIEVGSDVEFESLRKLGRVEAASIRPIGR